MSNNCPIMNRMKSNYENRSKTFLTRRIPVIIRLDGKAFHTYTRRLNKPFDEDFISCMKETTKFLCENIQGAKLGYCQSDEISILLTDYNNLNTEAWFDYNIQKITSVSASMCTAKFNQIATSFPEYIYKNDKGGFNKEDMYYCIGGLKLKVDTLAYFDSRAFNIPKEEVSNYFLARQKDAIKNSISMLTKSLYSHYIESNHKNSDNMQDMCFKKGYNWNDLHYSKKRGSTTVKTSDLVKENNIESIRSKWIFTETPELFDNDFFNKLI